MQDETRRGAIVLCGGQSKRMGRDKASLPFGPELMLQRVVRIVSEVVNLESIVVVAADGQILPELPAAVVVARDQRADRGPLEGLAGGLRCMPKNVEAVYVTSCDVPLLKSQFICEMFNRLGAADIAVPHDGKFHHPLSAVYRTNVFPTLQNLLAHDCLRMSSLLDKVETIDVDVEGLRAIDPTLSSLLNCNRPEDYDAALVAAGFAAQNVDDITGP